jgi:Fe2+ or Zn2+ uptake regulation protein
LLRTQVLKEGTVVFDPNVRTHHHFIDEESGKIYDIPWNALKVVGREQLQDFDIHEYQVVMRGRRKRSR